MKRNKNIPQIPQPTPKPPALPTADIESLPLPALAASALAMASAEYNRVMTGLVLQTLETMGLKVADGWVVDVDKQVVFRAKITEPGAQKSATAVAKKAESSG